MRRLLMVAALTLAATHGAFAQIGTGTLTGTAQYCPGWRLR
jgi:hypothetical protein